MDLETRHCQNGVISPTKGSYFCRHGAIWTIIKIEEDIMVLNNVPEFHKVVTQITGLMDLLLSPYPCFISLLYLDLYVLGDDALIS